MRTLAQWAKWVFRGHWAINSKSLAKKALQTVVKVKNMKNATN